MANKLKANGTFRHLPCNFRFAQEGGTTSYDRVVKNLTRISVKFSQKAV